MHHLPKTIYLNEHREIWQNKTVLDLACHDGRSSQIIADFGAAHVFGVDIRQHLIEKAQALGKRSIDFCVGDITDSSVIGPLVKQSQVVVLLGVLYHLFDHFRFFSHILKPHVEYCLIETLFGTESTNAEMVWGYEDTSKDLNGWCAGCATIPNGTPNLSWILQSASIFGFNCDFIRCYGTPGEVNLSKLTLSDYHAVAGPDWPDYATLICTQATDLPKWLNTEIQDMLAHYAYDERRMIVRLYNRNLIASSPLNITQHYRWPF